MSEGSRRSMSDCECLAAGGGCLNIYSGIDFFVTIFFFCNLTFGTERVYYGV